jgi:hypothetical protein
MMDPQACFEAFRIAVSNGDLDDAAQCERDYNGWRRKGGFPAKDVDGMDVDKLDGEQDRYLATDGVDGVERWRKV